MRENYNEFNFFVRTLGCRMDLRKDSVGANGLSELYCPSMGLREEKSPAIARHVGAEGLEPPAFSV